MTEDLLKFSIFYTSSNRKLKYFRNHKDNLLDRRYLESFFGVEKTDFFFDLLDRKKEEIRKYLKDIEDEKLLFLNIDSETYPERLKNIPDSPCFLFVRGNSDLLHREHIIGMVGARKTDEYGKRIATEISSGLAENNIVIISGLAAGIDSVSHAGCLEKSDNTIAVTAADYSGFPRSNQKLADNILEKGAIVSEYPKISDIHPEMFIVRNRIIAGLSDGVIIVRATLRSGSLWTAEFALNYDRDVLAVCGNIYENLSGGTNELIKRGAVPVFSYEDVLEYMNIEKISKNTELLFDYELCSEEKKVYDILEKSDLYIDDIIMKSGLASYETMRVLNSLVFRGLVKKSPGNRFYKI